MSTRKTFVAFAAALALTAASATAQWEVNGANASMTMQGAAPSAQDPINHNVEVTVPGGFNITIDSGANAFAGIIMLFSFSDPSSATAVPTPLWGGQLEVGNGSTPAIQIIADGISFTVNPTIDQFYRTNAPTAVITTSTFTQFYSASQFLCNTRGAWQAIVQDSTNPPIFIDNTECGDANFVGGQEFILLTGDDGTVTLPFLLGNSFPFHGVAYTDIWVNANGYVNFGSYTTVIAAGFVIDTVGMVNAEPAIFPCNADWGMGTFGSNDGVYYKEGANSVLISWGDVRGLTSGAPGLGHFGSNDTNNQFDLTLQLAVDTNVNICGAVNANAGAFNLAFPRFDATTTYQPGDGAIGHTPGGAAIAANLVTPASQDLEGNGVTVTGTAVPAVEEHNATGGNYSTLGWDGAGSPRAYNEVRNWAGNSIAFIPVTAVVTGDLGYVGFTANPPADDVLGTDITQFSNAGGTAITATGKFFGFGAGSVVFTDSALNSIPVTGTVFSGTGPYFSNEGLSFTSPAGLAAGPGTITFNFGSGYVESVPVLITSPCQVINTVTEGDDTSVFVSLTGGVTHYGVTYTGIWLGSNGMITFQGPGQTYVPSSAEFFGGIGFFSTSPGNAAVCWMWCDLYQYAASFQVIEDPCQQTVTCSMSNMSYFVTPPAGNCTVTLGSFGPDTGTINWNGVISHPSAINIGVGLSDGIAGGDDTVLTYGVNGFESIVGAGYSTPTAGPESLYEEFPGNTFAADTATIGSGTGIMNWIIGGGLVTLF